MNYSTYQTAIFNHIKDSDESAIIEAVAGSGKTTTIVHGSKMLHAKVPGVTSMDNMFDAFDTSSDSLFIAFNKHIAEALAARLPSKCVASTLHSLGYSMCRQQLKTKHSDPNKVDKILDKIGIANPYKVRSKEDKDEAKALRYSIVGVLSIIKSTLCDPRELVPICDFYNTYVHNDQVIPIAYRVLEISNEQTEVVDFDDMFYLPLIHNCKFQPVKCVFVDEEQDMCRAQNEFIARFNSRVIAVGDRRQSIYGFRGADPSAMDWLKTRINAKELPLSICYRCPKSVIRLAQTIVPQIEAWEDAEEGVVRELNPEQFHGNVAVGDMVLCRYNAPLVEVAFEFIKEGVKATVKGRDIGKNIATFARKFYKAPRNMEVALGTMKEHYTKETTKPCTFEKRRSLMDKISVVNIIASKCSYVDEVPTAIESLFSDEKGDIVLSSIHKAKGEEADCVFIIETEDKRHGTRQEWEEVQEANCRYVAITRAKKELCFVKQEEEQDFLNF